MMKTKILNRNEGGNMADDAGNRCDKCGAVDRSIMIPAIQRY